MSTTRSHADLNRDRWIQSPECWPLHHRTAACHVQSHIRECHAPCERRRALRQMRRPSMENAICLAQGRRATFFKTCSFVSSCRRARQATMCGQGCGRENNSQFIFAATEEMRRTIFHGWRTGSSTGHKRTDSRSSFHVTFPRKWQTKKSRSWVRTPTCSSLPCA